jgi:hypothetical protein
MATLSASRRNSANSTPSTPRPSITGNSVPRMSSLNEEEANSNINILENVIKSLPEEILTDDKISPVMKENGDHFDKKIIRRRACSERSDSGISDCSSHLTTSSSCTSTPLLGKKFPINEEPELQKKASEVDTAFQFISSSSITLSSTALGPIKASEEVIEEVNDETNSSDLSTEDKKLNNVLKLESKIDTLTKRATAKCEYAFLFD